MRRWTLAIALSIVGTLVIAGCSDDDATGEDGTPSEEASSDEGTTSDGATAADADAAEPADEGSDGAGGQVTIDGTTYEITNVVDCTVGHEGFPDDRQFQGTSADGNADVHIAYTSQEELAALTFVDLELTEPAHTYSSMYAADPPFEISLRADGAEGDTMVAAVGVDAPQGELPAEWSFTC